MGELAYGPVGVSGPLSVGSGKVADKIIEATKLMIQAAGEDPNREGLRRTPERVARAYLYELFKGYGQDPRQILAVQFSEGYDGLVLAKDIEFYSICEHHLLPFWGVAHVGYLACGRVVGVSKLARLVECFSRRLQVQERLTQQIGQALEEIVYPDGVGVILEARHFCMMARGVEKQQSVIKTSYVSGALRETGSVREEFLKLCGL